MALCHLESYGDKLARGMSWPINVSNIVAALEARPEAEIWLSAYRSNTAQSWLPYRGLSRCPKEALLVSIDYEFSHVTWKRRWSQPTASRPAPAWYDLDDPPLIHSRMYSIPAGFMRDTGLTKSLAAAALADGMAHMLPNSITGEQWQLDLVLNIEVPAILCRRSAKPLRDWTLVGTRSTKLEPTT